MADFVREILPILIGLAVFVLFAFAVSRRQTQAYKTHVSDVMDINNQLLASQQEMVAELREIKSILKERA